MIRGFLLDCARCIEQRGYYRRVIDFISACGCNALLWHFTDDQGCMYDFQSVPGIGSPHAYSRQEMKDLIHYAADHGIDLIPEVASLGHSMYITRLPVYRHLDENESPYSGMCPVARETRDVLKRLIDETADVFESPYIHVGLDEVNFGKNPSTRDALKKTSRGKIFCDHVGFMHEIVSRAGRQMWMWGDGLLADEEIFAGVSRDITICNWQYQVSPSMESTQRLLNGGFKVINVPALISHHQTLLAGERCALNNVAEMCRHGKLTGNGAVIGTITSAWMPMRYLSEAQWLGMHIAADMMRDISNWNWDTSIQSFLREFYGIKNTAEYLPLFRKILQMAPVRQEWMNVVKHDNSTSLSIEYIQDTAHFWRSTVRQLSLLDPAVIRHRPSFAAFVLTVQLLAHAFESLAACKAAMHSGVMTQTLSSLHHRGRHLLDQVYASWDRERFTDDPCRRTPALDVFRDEHLTLLLADGLDALESGMSVGSQQAQGS